MSAAADVIAVADAIVADLNGAGLEPSFTAARTYEIIRTLDGLTAALTDNAPLLVSVLPIVIPQYEPMTRAKLKQDSQVAIVLQAKLADQTTGSIDPYLLLCQQIADRYLVGKPLPDFDNGSGDPACTLKVEVDLLDREWLEEIIAYMGIVALTVRTQRSDP